MSNINYNYISLRWKYRATFIYHSSHLSLFQFKADCPLEEREKPMNIKFVPSWVHKHLVFLHSCLCCKCSCSRPKFSAAQQWG